MNNIECIGLKCVGCRSCEQICPKNCIEFKENQEGFLYPNINNDICVQCGLCLKHCPMNEKNNQCNSPLKTYALKNKDQNRIMQSASGGASDIIAQYIISIGGIVFGCAYTDNLKVKHILVDKFQDLYKIQSSKYVQSNIGNCYLQVKELLDNNKIVLFTGTPCQIAGLYSFLGYKEYENLYTIDLICHGVPSPKFLDKYFDYMSKELSEPILEYNFRSKDNRGWGTQYLIKTKTKTKTKTKILSLDKYGKHFMSGDCYRESCYQCKYANTNRVSDITIGDFWGIQKCYPEFFSEKGVSSIIVNTQKGENLIKKLSLNVDIMECTLDDVLIKQGNLIKPTLRNASRDTFYKNIQDDNFIDNIKVGLCLKDRIKSIIPKKIVNKLKQL